MSAVIWLGIVVVWGFVVIPLWIRHHDGVLEQRSAERFSTAMRVLTRRGPRRPDGRDGVSTPSTHHRESPAERAARAQAEMAAVRTRRARRLLYAVAVALVTLLLAVAFGGTWIALHVMADLALGGYVVQLRKRALSEQRLRAARRAHERRAAAYRAHLLETLSHRDTGDLPIDGGFTGYVETADGDEDELEEPPARTAAGHVVRGAAAPTHAPPGEPAADAEEAAEASAGGGTGWSDVLPAVEDAPPAAPASAAAETGWPTERAIDDTQPFSLVHPDEVPAGRPDPDQDAVDTDPAMPIPAAAAGTTPPGRASRPRPGSRPQTSRPGRVQVNPPGTAAPRPPAAPPVAPPAAEEGLPPEVAATLPPEEPDELDQLLDRNVVNG